MRHQDYDFYAHYCYLLIFWNIFITHWNHLCPSEINHRLQSASYAYFRFFIMYTWLSFRFPNQTYLLHGAELLTPCSKVVLEELTASQLLKKFPAFYGTQRFITAFTSARHLSLSWASSFQSMSPYPTFWSTILILSSHLRLGLSNGLFPSGFLTSPYQILFIL